MSWPPPPYTPAEERAWAIVTDALETAIDEDGLQPHDRGILARMHQEATLQTGGRPVIVPDAPTAGSICRLALRPATTTVLQRHGVHTVPDLLAINESGRLLAVKGIGPARLSEIRDAIDAAGMTGAR